MATFTDDDQLGTPNHPFLLGRRLRRAPVELDPVAGSYDPEASMEDLSATVGDRMGPAASGTIAGLFGGMAALGVIHGLVPNLLGRAIVTVADARGVEPIVALTIAYATAAAAGSLVGATFAVVTRYLRKWAPLLVWALVFFVSLTMLAVACLRTYGRGIDARLVGPVFLASAAFAILFSFSLPIRRRR
jgi:hypothetical protein